MRPERVWYLAYGSNVNEGRFLRYLLGDDDHRGARDTAVPLRNEWVLAPLRLTFAKESVRWNGGGVAFVDPDPAGATWVRAWDITAEQFEDLFAQENRLPADSVLDWARVAAGPHDVGTGWYRRVLPLGDALGRDDQPVLTFTWHEPSAFTTPNDAYADTIAAGLADNPALSPADIAAYLSRLRTYGDTNRGR
jgi:hypothetical protein